MCHSQPGRHRRYRGRKGRYPIPAQRPVYSGPSPVPLAVIVRCGGKTRAVAGRAVGGGGGLRRGGGRLLLLRGLHLRLLSFEFATSFALALYALFRPLLLALLPQLLTRSSPIPPLARGVITTAAASQSGNADTDHGHGDQHRHDDRIPAHRRRPLTISRTRQSGMSDGGKSLAEADRLCNVARDALCHPQARPARETPYPPPLPSSMRKSTQGRTLQSARASLRERCIWWLGQRLAGEPSYRVVAAAEARYILRCSVNDQKGSIGTTQARPEQFSAGRMTFERG